MSFSPEVSSQSKKEEDEVLAMLFPFLQDAPCLHQTTELAQSGGSDRDVRGQENTESQTPFTELLEMLLPSASSSKVELDFCCLCQEVIKEEEDFTTGLGCSCRSTYFHTTCFEKYLNSCETVAKCPCCRISWTEDLVIID